jgi:alkylation response protein AidB-like acyl-CoA dehydrogenase
MDIRFTDEEIAFQAEVQQFFANVMDDELKAKLHGVEASPDLKEGMIEYQRRLNAKGWMAPGWPVEYGGKDWSMTQHFIFNAERGKAGAPAPIPFGVTMVAPVIYTYGTDEQKARFLPRILNSDDWWCHGDDYVINGSKIWTSFAQAADWIFCLVRTDNSGRKQDGISFLLIDMTTPGVTVSPIETIDGIYHLNEVHFDNARVPVENRIGEEGKGWTYAKSLLVHERLSIAEVADSKRNLEQLRELARAEVNGGESLLQDPVFAKRLADVEIDLMALEFTELRVLASAAEGGMPGPESSLLKLQGTTIQQTIQELRMDVAGYYSQTLQGDLSAAQLGNDFADFAQKQYFRGRASSIYGGSDEVQKNVTAKHVLGL